MAHCQCRPCTEADLVPLATTGRPHGQALPQGKVLVWWARATLALVTAAQTTVNTRYQKDDAPLCTKDIGKGLWDLQSASKSSSSAQFVILGFGLRNWSKGSVVPFLEDMLSCKGGRPTLEGCDSAQYLSRKAVDRRDKKGVFSLSTGPAAATILTEQCLRASQSVPRHVTKLS